MSKWMWLTILAAEVAMILGCSQQPSGTAAMIEDKTYTVTPVTGRSLRVTSNPGSEP